MKIVILGVGVQETLYGVRLARAGHDVTLIARGLRARELRAQGAVIQHAITGRPDTVHLPVFGNAQFGRACGFLFGHGPA